MGADCKNRSAQERTICKLIQHKTLIKCRNRGINDVNCPGFFVKNLLSFQSIASNTEDNCAITQNAAVFNESLGTSNGNTSCWLGKDAFLFGERLFTLTISSSVTSSQFPLVFHMV